MNSLDFSHEDVERAARYHRPLYAALALGFALGLAVYSLLAWSWVGGRVWSAVSGLGWAGSAAAWSALVVAVSEAASLPLAYWRGHLRERRWGFSTQTPAGWAADRAKAFGVSVVLGAAAWVGVVGLARWVPGWWPVPAAAALVLAVLFLSFVAPVVLEPIFNRFRPLADERLAGELRALGERAGVPVRDVLVADASRRTTKTNAYVSGIGSTRRVVVFDTLLESADEPQVKLIVAHELGHRRESHVVKLTVAVMAVVLVAVVLVWAVLGTRVASARPLPQALLLLAAIQLAVAAPFAWLSRRYERVADRFALDLTGDLPAFERAFQTLARKNLSDLAPPKLAYLLLFTHPTPPERLALARAR
ncbi:MAG TPA: M48 family metalloprotease [Gaiellaceae bacterium]|nr:M48 family metalloprotease [Gaiellaceae bacterium]